MSLMGLGRGSEPTFFDVRMENPLQLILLVLAPYLESHLRMRVLLFSLLARTHSSLWASAARSSAPHFTPTHPKGALQNSFRRMPAKPCDEKT